LEGKQGKFSSLAFGEEEASVLTLNRRPVSIASAEVVLVNFLHPEPLCLWSVLVVVAQPPCPPICAVRGALQELASSNTGTQVYFNFRSMNNFLKMCQILHGTYLL
jgi:hypothetical protein